MFGSSSGPQLNDFNPGINPYPAGLFWTIPLHPQSVVANPGAGSAIYKAQNLQIEDYGDLNSAFSGWWLPNSEPKSCDHGPDWNHSNVRASSWLMACVAAR